MFSKLLQLIPMETLLRAGAMALISAKPAILKKVEGWIEDAQRNIKGGGDKFQAVKDRVLTELRLKSGYLLDTGLQMLVAWFKLKNPNIKFDGPVPPAP